MADPIGFRWDNGGGDDNDEITAGEFDYTEGGMYFPELNIFVGYDDFLRYAAVGLLNTLTFQGERVQVELARINQMLAQTQASYGTMNYLLVNSLTSKALELKVKLTEIVTQAVSLRMEIILRGW